MGRLSTHVLDTAHGCPAAGMTVHLDFWIGERRTRVRTLVLNNDGRSDGGPLLEGADLMVGRYCLSFEVARYFRAKGVPVAEPAFLDVVPIEFGVGDASAHYHVPLLVSPWSYSTYRGS